MCFKIRVDVLILDINALANQNVIDHIQQIIFYSFRGIVDYYSTVTVF